MCSIILTVQERIAFSSCAPIQALVSSSEIWLGNTQPIALHSNTSQFNTVPVRACMTPAQRWALFGLHLIGRNLQRQQPLTAQFKRVFDSCHSTHCTVIRCSTSSRLARLVGGLTLLLAGDWFVF